RRRGRSARRHNVAAHRDDGPQPGGGGDAGGGRAPCARGQAQAQRHFEDRHGGRQGAAQGRREADRQGGEQERPVSQPVASPSLRDTSAAGSSGTNSSTAAVVAALMRTSVLNVRCAWSISFEPTTSLSAMPKFRTLIISAKPSASQPAGVERTARSISDSSASTPIAPPTMWIG